MKVLGVADIDGTFGTRFERAGGPRDGLTAP